MFKNICLNSTYSTYENNIDEEFYIPVLSQSITYDRAAAYFSAKSLACYMKGIENTLENGFKYRLIISNQISIEDYNEIKKGYELRKELKEKYLNDLKGEVTLEEKKNLSNLAYLLSIGVLDIKMAFTTEGIFHDKFGLLKDSEGNIIHFRGSNNETHSAFNLNYEAFDITCSWLSSPFDYSKITKSIQTFESLWNNQVQNICIREFPQVLVDEIKTHNKGRFVFDKNELNPNTIYLSLENNSLVIYCNDVDLTNTSQYKLKLKRFVDNIKLDKITLKNSLTYTKMKEIVNLLEINQVKSYYNLHVDKNLISYIDEKELYITKRANLGIAIKQKSFELDKEYNLFKEIVNSEMSRKLREQQMRDSFYMYTMKKCSNFSVPGSGKTSSVLGVFAYLSSIGKINKLIMIGPKNSFKSWKDEFKLCFDNKKKLNLFSIQDYKTTKDKKNALSYSTRDKNLLLFNYEGLNTILEELSNVIDNKTLLVFDEVHKVKAIGGQRAEQALKISKFSNYIITLTGTPIPNSYLDLKNILEILYKDEYQEQFGFSDSILKNPDEDDIEEINKKIQPFFCRTTKSKLGVPEPNKNIIIESYSNSLENKLFKTILSKFRKNQFGMMIRLLQLQSNPKLLLTKLESSDFKNILDITATEENIDFIDYSKDIKDEILKLKNSQKFLDCLKLIEKLKLENKKVIVWCIFVDSILILEKKLKEIGIEVTTIYGSIEQDERDNRLERFKNENIQVLLTNPHTLAESVSLHHTCHDAIYFEYSYNLVHLLQSKDRIHRLGLSENQYTQYYFMQNNFTKSNDDFFNLDNKIYERLMEKEKIMIDAIENNSLEKVTTNREDIELILSDLLVDL
ncbi:MAG: SNF2-related protein [Fusobacteriaceae bacterium]